MPPVPGPSRAIGRSTRHTSRSLLTTALAIIGTFLSMLLLGLLGAGSSAWAGTRLASPIAIPVPSPYPNPGSEPPTTATPGPPAVPDPSPPAPPSPGTSEIAYPRGAVDPVPAWLDIPARSRAVADATTAASTPPRTTATAAGAEVGVPEDDLSRSLVYSGGLALVIAGSGLIMLGSRRRLW
jgi:hypothetical protein